MMELTDYEKNIFDTFSAKNEEGELKIKYGITYRVKPDRSDRQQFIEAIKKYIDVWGNIEFNPTYTKFKRIDTINRLQDRLPKTKRHIYDPTKQK